MRYFIHAFVRKYLKMLYVVLYHNNHSMLKLDFVPVIFSTIRFFERHLTPIFAYASQNTPWSTIYVVASWHTAHCIHWEKFRTNVTAMVTIYQSIIMWYIILFWGWVDAWTHGLRYTGAYGEIRLRCSETKMAFWRNFRHWLHWKLSKWKLSVLRVTIISSKRQHSRFTFSVRRGWFRYEHIFVHKSQ